MNINYVILCKGALVTRHEGAGNTDISSGNISKAPIWIPFPIPTTYFRHHIPELYRFQIKKYSISRVKGSWFLTIFFSNVMVTSVEASRQFRSIRYEFFCRKWSLSVTKTYFIAENGFYGSPKIRLFWPKMYFSIKIDIFQLKFGLFANHLLFWFCFVGSLGVSLSKVAVRPNELWVGYRTYRLVPDQISISTQSNLYTSNLSLFNSIRICPCPYMNTSLDGEVSKEIWFLLEPNSHNPNIDQKVISIE